MVTGHMCPLVTGLGTKGAGQFPWARTRAVAGSAQGSWEPHKAEVVGWGAGSGYMIMFSRACFSQPAVQKHRDEQVPQRRPEYLRWRRRVRGQGNPRPCLGRGSPTVSMKGSVLIISRMKGTAEDLP